MQGIYKDHILSHQREGINKLVDFGGKAILADEPGLGKTIQVLGYMLEERLFPALIIVPSSLKLNWKYEAEKWIKCDSIYICEGKTDIVRKVRKAREYKMIIINYDILIDWIYELTSQMYFKIVVFDEAHLIKEDVFENRDNPKRKCRILCTSANDRVSAANYACMNIEKKIFITGTPVVNGAIDLANFIYWIDPVINVTNARFKELFCEEVVDPRTKKIRYEGGKNLLQLNELLKEYMIRRKKVIVTNDLPNKVRKFIPVECAAYSDLGVKIKTSFERMQEERVNRTRFIMDNVKNWIRDFLETGKKLVVFCNFTDTVDDIKREFGNISVVFDGRSSQVEKDKAVKSFQEDEKIKLFISNLQAGGVGITLTAASDVLTVDFAHSVKDHYQAEDRVHRIGQKSDLVTAYYFYVPNSIDEQMVETLNKKAVIAKGGVDGEEVVEADLFLKDVIEKKYTKMEIVKSVTVYVLLFLLCCLLGGLFINTFFDKKK